MKEFKIFKKEDILDNMDLLMDFYAKRYDSNYNIALKNSSHVCCCIEDGKIVGACRLITDYCSHTSIVDLVVDREKRRNGIGRRLMEDAIKCILELNTYYNNISTDPKNPWLKDFYESLGFKSRENYFTLTYPKE